MTPEAFLSHTTLGRTRIKVPSMKGNAAYFSALQDHFAHFQGIAQMEANAVTSSVLFIHAADLKTIATFAEEHSLFRLGISKARTTTLSGNIMKSFGDFDKQVKKFTGNDLDVPGVAFVTLAGFGIYEISRGNFAAPAWYTAFWYALNVFLKSLPGTAAAQK